MDALHEMFLAMNFGDFIYDPFIQSEIPTRNKVPLTLLCSLVIENKMRNVEYLLINGHDVNEKLENGRTAIFFAVQCGYSDMVVLLIHHGANVNVKEPSGVTPLHVACFLHHKDIVQLLLTKKANIHADSIMGTPIIAAVDTRRRPLSMVGDVDVVSVVSLLIEHGADVNDKVKVNGLGELGPLHFAVSANNLRLVNVLIAAKADVNVSVYIEGIGKAPLLSIAAYNNVDIVKSFLTVKNLDRRVSDQHVYTALHTACEKGNLQVVKLLVESNFELNALSVHGETPLHVALIKRHFLVAEYLLQQKNINVNLPMGFHDLPLHVAIEAASSPHSEIQVKVIKSIIDKTKNLNAETRIICILPLTLAIGHNDLVTVKYLLQKGANVNISQSQREETPLYISSHNKKIPLFYSALQAASMSSTVEMVRLLLSYGAEVNNGQTDIRAHTLAIGRGDLEIVKELEKYGAEIDEDILSYSLSLVKYSSCVLESAQRHKINDLLKLNLKMMKSVRMNEYEEVKKSIEASACANVSHSRYGSPLVYASWKGFEDIVDLLLENGANVNFKSATGLTSLHMACRYNTNSKIVRKLLLHGAYYNTMADKNNNTPLKYAEIGKNENACNLLQIIDGVFVGVKKEKLDTVMNVLSEMKNNEKDNFKIMKHVKNHAGQTLINMARDQCGAFTRYTDFVKSLERLFN